MSVRFYCPACRQLLSITKRKVGSQVNCPKCLEPIVVPTAEATTQAATAPLHSSVARHKPGAESQAASPRRGRWAEHLAEFDDVAAAVGSQPVSPPAVAPQQAAAPQPHTARHLVPISRHVLYMQAVIILIVSLGALLAGYSLGLGKHSPSGLPEAAGPVKVAGRVTYLSEAGEPLPDAQAVILIFPQGIAPGDKIPIAGLRPEDATMPESSDAARAVEASDGFFRRADEAGQFSLELPPGDYAILAISRHAQRPGGAAANPADLQLLGGYFQSAQDLLGPYRYEYCERRLPDQAPLDFAWSK